MPKQVKVYCDAGGKRGLTKPEIASVILTPTKRYSSYARIPTMPQSARKIDHVEALAILRALHDIPPRSRATIYSDNKRCIRALNKEATFENPQTQKVIDQIHRLAEKRQLSLRYEWIPREDNLAGLLISRTHRVWEYGAMHGARQVGFYEGSLEQGYEEEALRQDEDPWAEWELEDITLTL